ncbi:MAG: ATP-binding protein [Muribaculaceae bacterium]|nr:ATP-binding protein [Muribaculaceae bacterium]
MTIKTKLTVGIGSLLVMIILLVAISVINLTILTATDPNTPEATEGLERALFLMLIFGLFSIVIGGMILYRLPKTINYTIKKITNGIQEIANHNYDMRLELGDNKELEQVSNDFNRMAMRLTEYHASTLSQLMASKKYMETVINSISEPILGLDKDFSVIFINDEALGIFNLKREDVLNRNSQEIALRNDLLRRLIRELVGNEKMKKELLKIYADNKESYFQAKYITITKPSKDRRSVDVNGYVIMLKNITEFKELDSAKTTFISTISHELKTPISAILMSLQLLNDSRVGEMNDEQKELADSIKDNSERLLNITGELLNMTQVEAGKLQLSPKITKPIELIEYAIKANRVQAEKFNIQIEVEYESENMSKLFVDSEKIAWVLTNLLSNAIRYSYENSRVVIGAKQIENDIELYVKDFGKGIDSRYHKSIFDHYFRVPGTKVQGSGLGLAISKDFVEAHGGEIKIESEIGKGSTFFVILKV